MSNAGAATMMSSETLHATSVAIDGRAVLIEGKSGEGKSDLALRLIDRGATLIADDRTICRREPDSLVASAPATIAGKIEVRGIGIVEMPYTDAVPVALLIAILDHPPRLPDQRRYRCVAGVEVPVLELAALEPSAPIKVELALRQIPA